MKMISLGMLLLIAVTSPVFAQCAPGIPGAGNPGCIPPTAPNSPYNQGDGMPPNAAPQGHWEDRWGSVAMDTKLGIPGVSEHMTSSSDATRVALDQCHAKGGKDCEKVLTYHNQCVAVAQDRAGGKVYTSSDPKVEGAAEDALSRCGGSGKCLVRYQSCSYQERVD